MQDLVSFWRAVALAAATFAVIVAAAALVVYKTRISERKKYFYDKGE
jgi:hypothetical protein